MGAAVKAVQVEIEDVKTATKAVELDIAKAMAAIEKVDGQLNEVDAQLRSASLSATDRKQLRAEKEQLRTELQQLRTELQQLRSKEEQLRNKEERLRNKEERLLKEEKQTQPARYFKRALLMSPPSQTPMRREQEDVDAGPLISNWRPTTETAAGQLPELMTPVFGRLVESLAGNTDVDQATIEVAGKLCCIGAKIYEREADLVTNVRDLLRLYLEDKQAVTINSGFTASSDRVRPDWALGNSAASPSNLFLVVEVKPGIGGSGDSHFQGANYLLHFWRGRADSDAFRNTCCPALLLEVVGPHMRLSAMAWLDRVTIFPLTPLLNLLAAHPVTDCLLMPVARALAALRTGVRELSAQHAAAAHEAEVPVVEAHATPAARQRHETAKLPLPWPIRMDSRYNAASAFQLAPHNPTYYVLLAGNGDSGGDCGVVAVVVKLCRKYGLEAHLAWAELDLAPEVRRAELLPGGWQLVEMEWLSEPEWQMLSNLPSGELGEALGAAEKALQTAHAATGMVHGDVRPPNCLVRRDAEGAGSWQVRFVDFEWAGREGQATYPACLNPDVPWPEGVGYGKQLQRAHDFQLLVASTASHATGDGQGAVRPGAVMSLSTAARDRCAMPLRKAAGVMLHRGVGVGWRQRAAAGWLRPAAPGRRLAW
ncbi:hypothetical protein TSOC_005547 [Tetrabaena socialis]|uniref:Protein kinase domain-containing protein n=1 Tax=Tetrabaena socialis TaxID=47790 RepID=A0A2J8A606_9CHLO|nr:hypothetical protein TSOC_005547 [Tetrabaena socialis]|eukprot:PNH07961.1 hypothetical protein TSOC_005547 [Tetrabaena socialis]